VVKIGFIVVAAEQVQEVRADAENGVRLRNADHARTADHRPTGKRTADCRATNPNPVHASSPTIAEQQA
jgi:hypothetical protein